MENEIINKDTRINLYNAHYGFLENPKAFDFDNNPQRLIVRNYALRNKDKATYVRYLDDFFPEQVIKESERFDLDRQSIKQYSNEEARIWMKENNVRILRSDINYTDQDAIFSVVTIADDEDVAMYLFDDDGFILNTIEPADVLKTHSKIWIDNRLSK